MLIEIIDSKTRDVDIVLTLMLIPRIKHEKIDLRISLDIFKSDFNHLESCILNSKNIYNIDLHATTLTKDGIKLISNIIRSNLLNLTHLTITCKKPTGNSKHKRLLENSLMVNNTLTSLILPESISPEHLFFYVFMDRLSYLNNYNELDVNNKELHKLVMKLFHLGIPFNLLDSFFHVYRRKNVLNLLVELGPAKDEQSAMLKETILQLMSNGLI